MAHILDILFRMSITRKHFISLNLRVPVNMIRYFDTTIQGSSCDIKLFLHYLDQLSYTGKTLPKPYLPLFREESILHNILVRSFPIRQTLQNYNTTFSFSNVCCLLFVTAATSPLCNIHPDKHQYNINNKF